MLIPAAAVMAAFPVAFLASYAQLRRYRDPIRCGQGCLHLPGCRFYFSTSNDRRKFGANTATSLVEEAEPEKQNRYIIYKTLAVLASLAILIPAIFIVAYHLRMIRLGFERCNCHHAKSCALGIERVIAPNGCEGWRHRGGYFDSPDGSEAVPGVRVAASPAREIHLRNARSEREKRREMRLGHA